MTSAAHLDASWLSAHPLPSVSDAAEPHEHVQKPVRATARRRMSQLAHYEVRHFKLEGIDIIDVGGFTAGSKWPRWGLFVFVRQPDFTQFAVDPLAISASRARLRRGRNGSRTGSV